MAPLAVQLGDKEISISASTAGTFSLAYPALVTGGEKRTSPVRIGKDADGVTLVYAAGGKGRVRLDGTTLRIAFSDLPAEVKQVRMEMLIPINFAGSGTYSIGGAAAQTFPTEKPAKPFLYQGNADRLEIVHPTGPGFSIVIPPYSFQQLQDNREWHWSIYDWWFASPVPEGNRNPEFVVKIDRAGAAGQVRPMVDRFGQLVKADFPTKVKADAELGRDAAQERKWLASLDTPASDPYGGLPGSGEKYGLKRTGYFHLGQITKAGGAGRRSDRPTCWSRPTATPSSSLACAASVLATITRRSAGGNRSTNGFPAARKRSFRPAAKATRALYRSTWPTRSANTASPTIWTAISAVGSIGCGSGASIRRVPSTPCRPSPTESVSPTWRSCPCRPRNWGA